jgi:hypothetical protein
VRNEALAAQFEQGVHKSRAPGRLIFEGSHYGTCYLVTLLKPTILRCLLDFCITCEPLIRCNIPALVETEETHEKHQSGQPVPGPPPYEARSRHPVHAGLCNNYDTEKRIPIKLTPPPRSIPKRVRLNCHRRAREAAAIYGLWTGEDKRRAPKLNLTLFNDAVKQVYGYWFGLCSPFNFFI